MILLTGFGAFRDVDDNPSARLVRALHGTAIAGHRVEARVLDVRWGDAVRATLDAVAELQPALVLGFGVATNRDRVEVERWGHGAKEGADVDGREGDGGDRDDVVEATVDVDRLATCLGAGVSEDAGAYLCNAWAHDVVGALDVPAAFVHVPPGGAEPADVARALAAYLRG